MANRSDVSASQSQSPSTSPTRSTFTGLVLRMWWMLLGNGALALVLVLMLQGREQLPSALDAAFAALVVSLVAVRLADIRYFDGCTAEGARATMAHFRRYAVRLVGGSAAGWGVANAVAAL